MMIPARIQRIPAGRRDWAQAAVQSAWEAARRDPLVLLWRLATAPLWLGSDIPMPDSPSREAPSWGGLEAVQTGPGLHVRDAMADLLRRYRWSWMLTSLLRGVSLGLWIALLWMLAALAVDVSAPNRWWIGGLMVVGLLIGAAFGVLNRPSPLRLARSLDQTFQLHERLATALDPALADVHDPAMQLQYADTANGLEEIRPEFGFTTFIPFREVFIALIAGLLLLAAFFANVPGGDLPPAASGAVPPFASAADRLAVEQTPAAAAAQSTLPQEAPTQDAKVLEQAQTSNQTRQDLEALGNALSDYALTKPASDSIAQGDYGQAAKDLQDAASNVDSLSPDARTSLADDLNRAASQMSPANPDLAQSTRDAADSLRTNDGTASERLDNLADEVSKASEKVAPNSQIAAGAETSTSAQGTTGASEAQGASGQQSGSQANAPEGAPVQGAGDPGSGAAAQPGIANEEIDPQNQQASQPGSESGEQAGGGGQAPADAGSGEGAQQPVGGDTASGEAVPGDGQSGNAPSGSDQNLPDEANAAQGGGAGGQSEGQSPDGESQQTGSSSDTAPDRPEANTAQQGKAGEPPPGGENGNDGSPEQAPSGKNSLVLEGTSDDNIASGSDVGSSSVGSGSGASAASGNAVPVPVGEAGPDSNRVPTEYRDYVEIYFGREQP